MQNSNQTPQALPQTCWLHLAPEPAPKHLYGIPPKPEGEPNPAEEVIAAAVLDTACVEILEFHQYSPLFYKLSGRYKNLTEELWKLLFDKPSPRPDCKVIQLQVA